MVKFEHISLSYGNQQVIFDLSFEIPDGKFVVLIGPSGCGKTTTLKMINRLIQPNAGHIYIDGEDIAKQDKVPLRRRIGYVIQQIGLFPNMTVAQNICVVPKLLKYPKERCEQIVRDMLAMVDMPYEQYAHKYPSEMSGGQQQRVGILRALAASPPIVLMDEPFSALDPMTRRTLQQEMKSLQQKLNKTIVFVTHDMEEALDLADLIIFMNHGKIEQMASPEEMLSHPATGLIHDFLGKHMPEQSAADLKVKEFMRTGVYTVEQTRGINECISKMQRHNVDTLIVVDSLKKYLGTVSITDIRLTGHVVDSIGPLIRCNMPTVQTEDNARACFDQLIESGSSYLVVLKFVLPVLSVFNTIPGIVFVGLLFIWLGMQPATVLIALSIYAMFPILKNTYAGLVSVDPQYIEAARGCGMTPYQRLYKIEIPLALPTIIGGLRMSTIYTVSWTVLAAMIGQGGLGTFIYTGISANDNGLILMGAIPAALLAFILGSLIDALQRKVVPKGMRKEADEL